MSIILRLLINTVAILVSAYLLPGVAVSGFWIALVVAVVLGVINVFIKPVLVVLTLPLTIMTLGLFLLVINAVLIQLASALIDGFSVRNFGWALLFSLLLSFVNSLLNRLAKPQQATQTTQTTFLH